MPDSVHAVLSPSSSEIWINCTPSARFAADFPDETTEYAAEGTEAHSLAEYKLRKALGEETGDPRKGMKYLTDEMEECTDDYVSFIMEKLSVIRETCPDAVIFIEQKLDLSAWVPEGFGYGDAIIVADGKLEIIDLKYGKGKMVDADWNSQFLLYALDWLSVLALPAGAWGLLAACFVQAAQLGWFLARRQPRAWVSQKLFFFAFPLGLASYRVRSRAYTEI